MSKTIELLEKRLARATKPPWVKWIGSTTIVAGPVIRNVRGRLTGGRGEVAECDDSDFEDEGAQRNARLIVAAVNALPALLAVAKAAKVASTAEGIEFELAYRGLMEALRALEEGKP